MMESKYPKPSAASEPIRKRKPKIRTEAIILIGEDGMKNILSQLGEFFIGMWNIVVDIAITVDSIEIFGIRGSIASAFTIIGIIIGWIIKTLKRRR